MEYFNDSFYVNVYMALTLIDRRILKQLKR